jgi:hypothetical protein
MAAAVSPAPAASSTCSCGAHRRGDRGRVADPEQVARWITLLLNPVSSFLTGAMIPWAPVR